jgi:peptide/nickel transport system ATP-binding protein
VTAPALLVEDLVKRYPLPRSASAWAARREQRAVTALDLVSFEVPRGHVLGIVGESGCGKTTLARCIVRLVEPDSGVVRLGDRDLLAAPRSELRSLRRHIQIVFQDPYTSLNPRLTIGEAIGEAARVHGIVDRAGESAFVAEMLELVGLPASVAGRSPKALSGGQRQRAVIARALAVKPEVLIADEAVSALDVSIQAQILNLLRRLTDELGLATVFIAHQLAVVAHISDSVAVMYLGQVVEQGPTRTVFSSPQHPYTAALLAAHPEPGLVLPEQPAISGDIPSPLDVPPGCRFQTRCAFAQERCAQEPPVVAVGEGHTARCAVLPFGSTPSP